MDLEANFPTGVASDLLRAQVAESAAREDALQEAPKFQLEEQRNYSMVDRVQRDAEFAMSVVKADLGDATAPELALHTSLEDEMRCAWS